MAKKYKLLLKMQLYSLFGINRLLHSHNKKEKNRTVIVGIAGLAIIGILVYLNGYIMLCVCGCRVSRNNSYIDGRDLFFDSFITDLF